MALWQRSRVALVNAANGERYALPGVGEVTIPADHLKIEDIIGKELHALEKSDAEGTFRLARTPHPANEIIRTAAPVCGFVNKDGKVRTCGPIAPLADENGNVFVIFSFTPLRETVEKTACADLGGIRTPPSDEDCSDKLNRYALASELFELCYSPVI